MIDYTYYYIYLTLITYSKKWETYMIKSGRRGFCWQKNWLIFFQISKKRQAAKPRENILLSPFLKKQQKWASTVRVGEAGKTWGGGINPGVLLNPETTHDIYFGKYDRKSIISSSITSDHLSYKSLCLLLALPKKEFPTCQADVCLIMFLYSLILALHDSTIKYLADMLQLQKGRNAGRGMLESLTSFTRPSGRW